MYLNLSIRVVGENEINSATSALWLLLRLCLLGNFKDAPKIEVS